MKKLLIAMACAGAAIVMRAAPAQQATPATPGRGAVIRGHVRDDNGRPLQNAAVRLRQASPTASAETALIQAFTDRAGAYELANVPAGSYRIAAGKPPYLVQEFGQRRSFDRGDILTVAEGQRLEQIDVVLPRGGAIAGRVLDEHGDAVQGAAVTLYRIESSFETRSLTIPYGVPGNPTDDRGRYRRYAVPPGRYVVAAALQGGRGAAWVIQRTYYPGTLNAAEAQTITVGPGQEVTSVDLSLLPGVSVRVAGIALDSAGRPLRGSISLVGSARAGIVLPPIGMTTSPAGAFAFPSVAPGAYVVKALGQRPDPRTEPEFGAQRITVGTDDMDVRLVTSRGATLSGRVVFEGAAAGVSPDRVTVTTVAADPELTSTNASGYETPAGRDGRFRIGGLVGPRRVHVSSAPEGWTLKSVSMNGIDVTDQAIAFDATRPDVTDVEVVLTSRAGGVHGSVTDAAGRRVMDYALVAYAVDTERWYEHTRFVRFVRPADDGTFAVAALPSGAYYVAALEWLRGDGTRGEWQDPALLQDLESRATRVMVVEGQQASLSLRLIAR